MSDFCEHGWLVTFPYRCPKCDYENLPEILIERIKLLEKNLKDLTDAFNASRNQDDHA